MGSFPATSQNSFQMLSGTRRTFGMLSGCSSGPEHHPEPVPTDVRAGFRLGMHSRATVRSCRGRGCLSDFGNYSRTRETVPNYFPTSENSFRCRGTVSDIGKRFPMSGNRFRYREQSRFPNYFSMSFSDVGKRFPISGNGLRCRGTSRSL